MRRHELSDAQWELIADLMPRSGQRGGGRWRDHRQVVNRLMWKLSTGAPWRDLPERHGPVADRLRALQPLAPRGTL